MSKKLTIGEQVKAFRMEHLITQQEAVQHFGVSLATIKRVEGGGDCGDLTRARIQKKLSSPPQVPAASPQQDPGALPNGDTGCVR